MTNEEDIAAIEISIEHAKQCISLGDALDRLGNNPDFKLVFLEQYLREEPIRLTRLKAAPAMRQEEHQNDIVGSIDAIGQLIQYLGMIESKADMARNAVKDSEMALEELYSEGSGEAA
jgi:hypothetical protein